MIISGSSFSTEMKNCTLCHHRTGNCIEYGNKDGISIEIPVCEKCKDKVGLFLREPMKAVLKTIECSVTASKFITEDEKIIQEFQIKKVGEPHV